MRRCALLVPALLQILACGGPDAVAPVPRNFPTGSLQFLASASGTDAGKSIDCHIDGILDINPVPVQRGTMTVYTGTGGGEAFRSVLASNGSGISFSADYYQANIEIRLIGEDSVEVRDVSPYADPALSRFWNAMTFFPGSASLMPGFGNGAANGAWTCFPLDTPPSSGGYYDADGIAVGTWHIPDPNNR
jgi:hypothetical protein